MRYQSKVVLASLLLVACSGTGAGGQGGGAGSAGTTGTGGTSGTGGHGSSGGATGGSGTGGARDGGSITDAGHDMSGPSCRSDSDCSSATFCITPGRIVCATCTHAINPCTSDSDCAPDAAIPLICARAPCDCTIDTMVCKPGCMSDADCGFGNSCSPTHHCAATPCGPGLPACPTDLTCATAFASCGQIVCSSDSQCSKACVNGVCSPTLGQCLPPS
jgi:Dickkopf N-terminal cysteine-rich region